MTALLKIVYESIVQALQSLSGNKMRTFLSLLGIVIGIFCIIAVKSAVDSLQDNILSSFDELGSDVLYVDKMPWNEDPGQSWWKYARRPNPSMADLDRINERSNMTEKVAYAIYTGGKTAKYKSNSVSNTFIMGSSYEYNEIQNLEIEKGRYFTPTEYHNASNKIILGRVMADALFGNIEPVGKSMHLYGQKFQVIGVLKKEGESMINIMDFDEVCWMGYNTAKKFVNIKDDNRYMQRNLIVKAKKGVELPELRDELTGILRSKRKLKPSEDNNFAINQLSMITDMLDSVFGVLNLAGLFIGIFALIVGMFSVANIMFVSVKERTNIIGIKKALGAKRYIILLEFLIESIILCIIGGLIGLVIVYITLKIISSIIPFAMGLSVVNIIWGVGASVTVGIIAGIIPAFQASKMNPVDAIRS